MDKPLFVSALRRRGGVGDGVWAGVAGDGLVGEGCIPMMPPALARVEAACYKAGMAHLEGRQSILAALRARQRRFEVILVRHGTHAEGVEEVVTVAGELGVAVRHVDAKELERFTHGGSHGGLVAICGPKPRAKVEEVIERIGGRGEPALMLLLEGVDDARNLGFTLRTAEAMGVHAVLIKKHLWDFDETEVARPASGAYERLPLVQIEDVQPLVKMQQMGVRLIGCLANVKQTIYEADLTGPTILAIGGEKRGLSGAVRSICDGFITIPLMGEATSLSLSHAGAIVMAEAMRQRRERLMEGSMTKG